MYNRSRSIHMYLPLAMRQHTANVLQYAERVRLSHKEWLLHLAHPRHWVRRVVVGIAASVLSTVPTLPNFWSKSFWLYLSIRSFRLKVLPKLCYTLNIDNSIRTAVIT